MEKAKIGALWQYGKLINDGLIAHLQFFRENIYNLSLVCFTRNMF